MNDDNTKSYYTILGCEESSSFEVIKKCYHEKALLHHPDKGSNNGKEKDIIDFDIINKAWKTLSDPESRRVYNAQLSERRFARKSLVFGTFNVTELIFDSDNNTYNYLCRCGGTFVVDCEDLTQAGDCDVSVECDTCSLVIQVNQT